MLFFDKIYNDKSQYDGFLCVCMKDKNNVFKTVKYVKRSEINDFITCKFSAYPGIDYYITANSLTRMSRSSALLAYNNIVIDVDAHDDAYLNGVPPDAEYEINDFIWRCVNSPDVPTPTLTHKTGRGIQFWYHFEQISSKCSVMYNTAVDALINAMQGVIDDNNYTYIQIDTGASRKPTGLFRLIGTYNTKTGIQTTAEAYQTDYKTIQELLMMLDVYVPQKDTTQAHRPPIKATDCNYTNLHKARLNVLAVLAEQQHTAGKRNTICWLSYNSLIQLYPITQAQAKLDEINAKFFKPLRKAEIKAMIRSIDNKEKYYDFITVSGFCKMLNISEQFYHENSNPRTTKRKKKATEKQKQREKIAADIQAGIKYATIAEKYDISIRTVNNIAKKMQENACINRLLNTG